MLIRYLLRPKIGDKGKPFKSKDGRLHLTDARQKKGKSKFYCLSKTQDPLRGMFNKRPRMRLEWRSTV